MKRSLWVLGITATVFSAAMVYEYLRQLHDEIGMNSGFRFSARREQLIYAPNSRTRLQQDDDFVTNVHGLWGREVQAGERLVLVLGSSTSLRYAFELQNIADELRQPLVFWSGARWHNTLREVRLEWASLGNRIFPDVLLFMPGLVFYRDIEHYDKDIYAIPESVVREKAFAWWSGGVADWLDYWWMKRKNQFYFSEDNALIRAAPLREPDHDARRELVERSLKRYREDLEALAGEVAARHTKLVLLTSPLNRSASAGRSLELMESFNGATRAVAARAGTGLIDLVAEFPPGSENFFTDRFHWNKSGTVRAAEIIHARLFTSTAASAALSLPAADYNPVASIHPGEETNMIGKKAPAFTVKDQHGTQVSLKDFSGRYVVLYFYPKDDTPGCTKESCRFRDLNSDFAKEGAVILGLSADDEKSHQKFIEKHGLNFTLLCDTERKVLENYGAWGEKEMYGKTTMGIIRSTVIIDPAGKVAHHWPTVKGADVHPDAVLAKLKELKSGG